MSEAAGNFVDRYGLSSRPRQLTTDDVVSRIASENLKTVRVSFADQHGILRGKVVMARDIESAINNGISITSTLLLKDTSHATVFPIWGEDAGFGPGQMTGASDLLMLPDPSTFKTLDWTDDSGWLLCDLYQPDGTPVALSTRQILGEAVKKLAGHGLALRCGLEVEFYVYRLTEPNLGHEHSTRPQSPPDTELLSHGYQYLTEQHYDLLEPVMALIHDHAERLDLPLRSLESEFGPSQFEVTFHPQDALACADTMMLFRSMVKQVCRRQGLHATFMCRPKLDNAMGNGWHLHQSLIEIASGENRFVPRAGDALSAAGSGWVAGILEHALAACLLSTPTVNGYKRYQPFALAPDRVQWGRDNRGAMIRVLCDADSAASRIENRIGEPAANPYLYIASQILSGLDGLERKLVAPAAVESPYTSDAVKLPATLAEAIAAFDESVFMRGALGDAFVDYYLHIKRAEWQRFMQSVSEWEHKEYFSLF